MDSNNTKESSFGNSVAIDGLIVGGVLAFSMFLSHLTRGELTFLSVFSSMLSIFGLLFLPYILAKRYSVRTKPAPFPFGKAFAYVIAMYTLTGIIIALSFYVVTNLDLNHYIESYNILTDNKDVEGSKQFASLVRSPIKLALSYLFIMPFLALIPSLIVAAFVKRNIH